MGTRTLPVLLVLICASACGGGAAAPPPTPTAPTTPVLYVLNGTVATASGQGIEGAVVVVSDGAHSGKRAVSDRLGRFTLGELTSPAFSVNVSADHYVSVNRTPEFVGTTATLAVTLSARPCVPLLLSPVDGARLDNGRYDNRDVLVWDFDWADCPGAQAYRVFVAHRLALNPVVDEVTRDSQFNKSSCSWVSEVNLTSWYWRVRAQLIDGNWSDWTAERPFVVEHVDTDRAGASCLRVSVP